jgi:hypothetical protein
MGEYLEFEKRKCKINLLVPKIKSEPVQKKHLKFKQNFTLSMFGIRNETKIMFSLSN